MSGPLLLKNIILIPVARRGRLHSGATVPYFVFVKSVKGLLGQTVEVNQLELISEGVGVSEVDLLY